jgi:hypothetical protein
MSAYEKLKSLPQFTETAPAGYKEVGLFNLLNGCFVLDRTAPSQMNVVEVLEVYYGGCGGISAKLSDQNLDQFVRLMNTQSAQAMTFPQ